MYKLSLVILSACVLAFALGCSETRPEIKIRSYSENRSEGTVTVKYNMKDMDGSSVSLEVRYSTDGYTYKEASPGSGGSGTSGLEPGEDGKEFTYVWNYAADIGNGRCMCALLKLLPKDEYKGRSKTVGPMTLGYPYLFAAESEVGRLMVINSANDETGKEIESGRMPTALAISPGGSRVYIANSGSSTVSVYDVPSGEIIETFPVGAWPSALALTPDGSKLCITLANGNELCVYDLETYKLVESVSTGKNPSAVAFTPDNASCYVANTGDDTVWIFDADNLSTGSDSVIVGDGPVDMLFLAGGGNKTSCYLVCTGDGNSSGTLEVFETSKPAGSHTEIELNLLPTSITTEPYGNFVFVTNFGNDSISIISTDLLTKGMDDIAIETGAGPRDIILGDDGKKLYVACVTSGEIRVISAVTFELATSSISVTGGPWALAVSPFVKDE
jgi:YVTN family beta-propeller protein